MDLPWFRYTGSRTEVRCKCGHLFCFRCGSPAHEPATCSEIQQFEDMVAQNTDQESLKYMMATYAAPSHAVPTPFAGR